MPTTPPPRLVTPANHGTVLHALSARTRSYGREAPMKIVKLEDFHADGGWDTYSFLKITTDEGLVGWSEFNESRRRGMTGVIHGLGATLIGAGPVRDRTDRRRALRHLAADRRRAHVPRHRRDRECLPRHQGQGARGPGLRAPRRRGARPDAGLLVALRGAARALRRPVRRQDDRPAGGAHPRRPQRRRARGARARLQGAQDQPAAVRRQGRPAIRARAWPVSAPAIPSSTSPTTFSTRSLPSSRPCAKAPDRACGCCSISTSTTSPRGFGASPRRSSRSTCSGSRWTCTSRRR